MRILKNKWLNWLLFKEGRLSLCVMLLALCCSTYIGWMIPKLTQKLYLGLDHKLDFYSVLTSCLILFVFEYINRTTYLISTDKYIQHLISYTRNSCYEKWLMNLKTKEKVEGFTLGEVLARIMSDTESLRELISSGAFSIFIDLSFIISCFISFIKLNSTTGIFFVIVEIATCFFLLYMGRYLAKIYVHIRKINSELSRSLANIAGGFSQSYFYKHHHYASKTTEEVSEVFLEKQLTANNIETSFFSFADSLFPIFLFLLVLFFPYSQISELAIIATLIDLIQRSISPIKDITGKISSVQRAFTGIERIDHFTTVLSEGIITNNNAFDLSPVKNLEVSIDNFKYEKGSFGLENIDFTANNGELIGIVGISGSGKSTLLKILTGELLDFTGAVKIIDANGKVISLKDNFDWYRQMVGLVTQESHVFSKSFEFNITLGLKTNNEFEDFYKFIKNEIYYINEWGIEKDSLIEPNKLSLGQKQLICALRSIFLKKPIVFFDEISSSLDSNLELALRKTILLIQKNALTIIVAHRIETLIHSDKILVMDKGVLKSSGNHSELLLSSEIYKKFINEITQFS